MASDPSASSSQPPNDFDRTDETTTNRRPVLRRFRRGVYGLIVVVSVALFIAVAAGWVLSRMRTDIVFASDDENSGWLLAQAGGEVLAGTCFGGDRGRFDGTDRAFHLSHIAVAANKMDLGAVIWLFMLGDRHSTGAGSAGFGYFVQTDAHSGETPGRGYFCPHWALLLLTAVFPAGWPVGRWRKRRRAT